jgi:hypothetical protein
MNNMEEVAKMLGVKMGEKFRIDGFGEYRFEKKGLFNSDNNICPMKLMSLFSGESSLEKFPWKPKNGEIYFQACIKGHVVRCKWFGDVCDLESYYVGNCFETEEEAEAHIQEILDKLREKYEGDGK